MRRSAATWTLFFFVGVGPASPVSGQVDRPRGGEACQSERAGHVEKNRAYETKKRAKEKRSGEEAKEKYCACLKETGLGGGVGEVLYDGD